VILDHKAHKDCAAIKDCKAHKATLGCKGRKARKATLDHKVFKAQSARQVPTARLDQLDQQVRRDHKAILVLKAQVGQSVHKARKVQTVLAYKF